MYFTSSLIVLGHIVKRRLLNLNLNVNLNLNLLKLGLNQDNIWYNPVLRVSLFT